MRNSEVTLPRQLKQTSLPVKAQSNSIRGVVNVISLSALTASLYSCGGPEEALLDLKQANQDTVSAVSHRQPSTSALPRLEQIECWFEDNSESQHASCFKMHVPENHGSPGNRLISFPVIKLSSASKDSEKTPVLHLGGGGPGNPMGFDAGTIEDWLWSWYQEMSVEDGRDLYLIDPRGVGFAEPVLVCTEYIPAFLDSLNRDLTIEQEVAWNIETNQRCMDRLVQEGIDMSAYNSLSVARDVELLRQQLRIKKWNLYGVSYGSRYALTLAREYPETVDSMVLDATVFPNVRYMDRYAENLEDAFERLISICADSAPCLNELVNPEQRFWSLVDALKRNPVQITIEHPLNKQKLNMVLNADRFLSILYVALYDAEQFSEIPQIIVSLENDQLGAFEEKVNDWLEFQTDASFGDASAAAHFCYEESPFIDYPKAIEAAAGLRPQLSESAVALLKYSREQCARSHVPAAPPIEGRPVVTDIPTLFLHGALDPVLPVEYLEQQLVHFSQSDYEIFSEISHSIVGVHPCGETMAGAFYNHKLEFRGYIDCMELQ